MALLTVTQLREHVETDLVDAALGRILASEEAEIARRCGPLTSVTELHAGGAEHLFLRRLVASITSVTETVSGTATLLAATYWELWWSQALKRLADGSNPRSEWGDQVSVVYVPQDDTAQRTLGLIQLCQLAVRYAGLKQESVGQGDHSVTYLEHQVERERIFRQLRPGGGIWLA